MPPENSSTSGRGEDKEQAREGRGKEEGQAHTPNDHGICALRMQNMTSHDTVRGLSASPLSEPGRRAGRPSARGKWAWGAVRGKVGRCGTDAGGPA